MNPQSFDINRVFLGPLKTSLKILLSRSCDITSFQEKDLDTATRALPLVSDVKTLIQEIANLKISPWQRCIIPENNNLTTIIVDCNGSTMAFSAIIYLLSSPPDEGTKASNLAIASSLTRLGYFYVTAILS